MPDLISNQPLFEGKAYRVDIPNWGISNHATAGDIVRFEEEELGNEMGVSADLLKELERYHYSDVVWVCKDPEDAENYLSSGMTRADITEIPIGEGARVIADDHCGGFLVLRGGAVPKVTRTIQQPESEVTEKEVSYGFLQLNEAEYQEAIGTGRYPEPKRYEELTTYITGPRKPGWKGLSLAEMFPTKYKELLSRGVPDKLSPGEVQQVIEERRIPYERRVEHGNGGI